MDRKSTNQKEDSDNHINETGENLAPRVKEFYDTFGKTFIRDLIRKNPRVTAVHRLFRQAIPAQAKSILVIGCGSGRDAWELVKRVAPKAKVLAVDISENNIRIAETLFKHPRVKYKIIDILEDDIEGTWQYIVLPDVYEHIPKEHRSDLHIKLKRYLTHDGKIILTCPTPWHQQKLREAGEGLQIIDEDVFIEDIQSFAEAIGGFVGLYKTISIWNANDYFHAIIEKKSGLYMMDSSNYVAIKGNPRLSLGLRFWNAFRDRSKLRTIIRFIRRIRIEKKLRDANVF